ncbi:MAG: hypothetical protein ACYCQJ_06320 [Nitrososphaerales archaeon]
MLVQNCEFPDDLYFDVPNDLWLKPLGKEDAKIGITTVLSFVAGRISAVHFKLNLSSVARGQNIATIESGKYFGAIRAPLKCRMVEFNEKIGKRPRLLNDDPYGEGFVATVRLEESPENLVIGNLAAKSIDARINELKVHCFKKLPDQELVSIGVECSSTLSNLNDLLQKQEGGTVVHVVSDDQFAEVEMVRWSDQTGNLLLETRDEGNLHHFIVQKKSS